MSKFGDIIKQSTPFGTKESTKSYFANLGGQVANTAVNTVLGSLLDVKQFGGTLSDEILDTEQPYRDKTAEHKNSFDILEQNDKRSQQEQLIFNESATEGHYVIDNESDSLPLKIPSWKYSDFINERNVWIKHLSNGLDEPNWLYFRIFFDFDTNFGLLGGILNALSTKNTSASNIKALNNEIDRSEETQKWKSPEATARFGENNEKYLEMKVVNVTPEADAIINGSNTAMSYLKTLSPTYYQVEQIKKRQTALSRFVYLLSNINTYSPWIFKGISQLNDAAALKLIDITKERTITIDLNVDTTDWRITTLLSLYKFVCFDEMNFKEIIPENLRKFDMHVVLFSAPIKYIHTPIYDVQDDKFIRKEYKKLFNPNQKNAAEETMSTKIFSFLNCEIKPESLGVYIPGNVSNEQPFQLGKGGLQIKYDRCIEQHYNEYDNLLICSNALCEYEYSDADGSLRTLNILQKVRDKADFGYTMLDASEYYSIYQLNRTFGNSHNFILGNIFGQVYNSFIHREDELPYYGSGLGANLTAIKRYLTKKVKEFKPVGKVLKFGDRALDFMGMGDDVMPPSYTTWGIDNSNGHGTVLTGYDQKNQSYSQKYADKLNKLLYGVAKQNVINRTANREQYTNLTGRQSSRR